jgi:biopolymer transport protein TolR
MSKFIEDGFAGDGPMGAINVTPMVDVMLCLLIIFMVATPAMTPESPMQIVLPNAVGQNIAEEQFLLSTISIDAKGNVFLGTVGLSADPAIMASELSSNAKLKEDGLAFLQGDKNISFDRIVDVLVALRTAGIAKVGFLTDPSAEKKPAT